MITRPLISILTPVFNQSSYIKQTIHSVLNQTYQEWEWVIVDDGSTDGTGNIISSIKDSRIKYTFQKHAGIYQLTETRNKALAKCNGNLIAMLDGDDYWPESKLEVQVKDFDLPDIVLSYGECIIVNENGRKIQYTTLPSDKHIANNNPVGSSLKLFLLKRDCFITNSTVMLNKKALLAVGGFLKERDLAHDFTTWTRLSLEGRFAGNPFCLGYRRRHLSSTVCKRSSEVIMNAGLDFLRRFVLMNKQRLAELGFVYDMDILDAHWAKLNPYAHYYTNAITALSCGSYGEGRTAFKKFLEGDPSLKQKLIYFLVVLSSVIRFDLVNPLANFRVTADKIMHVHLGRLRGRP
jgi:glycosyltransferase involved in cell wall biosynthesis